MTRACSPAFRKPRVNALALLANATAVIALLACALAPADARPARVERRFNTYANPIDLPYRYQPYRAREAADPTMVTFRGEYWLFPSKSHGYWHSPDLLHWRFVEGRGYDTETYAPTVLVMNNQLYLTNSAGRRLWASDDPASGVWRQVADLNAVYTDPALFLDDDGKLYIYHGLSGTDVLHVTELDPQSFQAIRTAAIPASRDKEHRGWEVVGDHNERVAAPSYIEGSWMNKRRGRYYLQYAAPGTEFHTYGDGVLVSNTPMGPFHYEPYSPFSFKPTGFATGAGHSSTFRALDGRYWHISTMSVSVRMPFERRLGLFPSAFRSNGELVADTYLGDYPHYLDGDRGLTGWMLLSRGKPVTASSALDNFPPMRAVDEDLRTWWSANTGDAGAWFQIDLGGAKTIEAVQINFADQDSTARGVSTDVYNYILELSVDGETWTTAIDHAQVGRDAPHDYEVLPHAQTARFVRLRNIHAPDGQKFSLSDLRVFGRGPGARPARVSAIEVTRDADQRRAHITWRATRGGEFYIVRLGSNRSALTQNYQVYGGVTAIDVPSLNAGFPYYVTVDSVNENGVTRGRSAVLMH